MFPSNWASPRHHPGAATAIQPLRRPPREYPTASFTHPMLPSPIDVPRQSAFGPRGMISATVIDDQAEPLAAAAPQGSGQPAAYLAVAGAAINEWPVIAEGFARPRISSKVGAASARRPSSRRPIARRGLTTTNGTG